MIRIIMAVLLLATSQVGAQDDNWTFYKYVDGALTEEKIPLHYSERIHIGDDNGTEVGQLTWGNGTLHFSGKMDESARQFIKYLNDHAPEFCEGIIRQTESEYCVPFQEAIEVWDLSQDWR